MAAAAAKCGAMATIEHLPDSLLGTVLACLGKDRAAAALLVSKRWHRVFLSDPALWRQFSIGHPAPVLQLALLQRVGGLVSSLSIDNTVEQQAEVVACLQPARLQDLLLWHAEPQLVAALPRFSNLTLLCIGTIEDDMPAGMDVALLALPHLRNLSLTNSSIAETVAAAVATCAQLTQLWLRTDRFEQPRALRQLTRLCQLNSISLLAAGEDACLHAPEPALLPALETFELRRNARS
ncbi:small GTP-binding [Chlorella sorokiniana]|uniref:Small GTP-binding n=1 Tax=Chlorella sorokiniana TaxID=3076 RepID=A0A2P6TMG6_CHLSO|nr:small GTP-binding [Chlorella sorokiniana]|eukprot:PRW45516.1 small GTP-binding [Chlorella sorokiniana]